MDQGAAAPPDAPARKKRLSAEERARIRHEQRLNQERRPEGIAKGMGPCGVPLRPGQRWPTNRDDREASGDCWAVNPQERLLKLGEPGAPYPRGSFPVGAQWELLPELARWASEQFSGALDTGAALWALADEPHPCAEFGLFLSDLLCREGLRARGLPVPPLYEYLQDGREEWGLAAKWLDVRRPGWRECYPIPGRPACREQESSHAE